MLRPSPDQISLNTIRSNGKWMQIIQLAAEHLLFVSFLLFLFTSDVMFTTQMIKTADYKAVDFFFSLGTTSSIRLLMNPQSKNRSEPSLCPSALSTKCNSCLFHRITEGKNGDNLKPVSFIYTHSHFNS